MRFIHESRTSSYTFYCSECGGKCHQVTGNCGKKIKSHNVKCTYKYCPNCGEVNEDLGITSEEVGKHEDRSD